MKSTLILLSIAAVLSLGILGPFTMAHGASHSGHCPIAMLSGTSCVVLSDVLGHLGVITGAMQGVLQYPLVVSLALILLLGIAFRAFHPLLVAPQLLYTHLRHEYISGIRSSRRTFLHWTSLLEHSPTRS